jgi:undecaprenyl-diphosphatase
MKLWKVVYVGAAVATAAVLATYVRNGHTANLDKSVTMALQRRRAPWFGRLMALASWAGFPPQSRTLPFVFPALFALAKLPREAFFQLSGWGTSGISFLIKSSMNRPRPSADEFTVHKANIGGTSFPSGHVFNYIGVYGTLAVILSHRLRSALVRRMIIGFVAVKIALVGPSRIYLGHHWFTDVLASYLLGSSYVIVLSSLYKRALRKG